MSDKKERAISGDYDVQYLDQVTALNWIKQYKALSYRMLEARLGSIILDAGCGTGDDVVQLANIVGEQGKIFGIDIDEEMLTVAKQRTIGFGNVILGLGDIDNLEFDDNTFDGCRADRVFQHLENPEKALQELIRVTKPGGIITIMDPDWDTLVIEHPNEDFTKRFLDFHSTNIFYPNSGRKLLNLFLDQGIEDIQIATSVLTLRSFEEANAIWFFENELERGINEKVFEKNEASTWFEELKAMSKRNRFFAACTGFGVIGRVN